MTHNVRLYIDKYSIWMVGLKTHSNMTENKFILKMCQNIKLFCVFYHLSIN